MSDTNGSTPAAKKERQWNYKFEGNVLVIEGRKGQGGARFDLDAVTDPGVRAEMLRNGGRQALGDCLNTRGMDTAKARYAAWVEGKWELESERGPAFPESFADLDETDRDVFCEAYGKLANLSHKAATARVEAAMAAGKIDALQHNYSLPAIRAAMRGIKMARNATGRGGELAAI